MPALRNVCPIRESDPMRPPTWKTLTGVLCGAPAIPEESVREWVLRPALTRQSSRCRCRRKSHRVRFLRNKPPKPALRSPNRLPLCAFLAPYAVFVLPAADLHELLDRIPNHLFPHLRATRQAKLKVIA